MEKVESPARTCQRDYELLAGVVDDRKILGNPTKASGEAGVERYQSPSTTRSPAALTSREQCAQHHRALVGRDISATSQPHTPLLGHLQTTTTTTYEGRASLEADLALADELTMACVREFFL